MSDATPAAAESGAAVLVVGGGFAGTAAAWAARRDGASVQLVHATPGASALYSGIVDGPPPSAEMRELGRELGLVIEAAPRAVATREGGIRSAYGRDAALLDLESVAGKRVGVADFGRDDWDAVLMARSLESSAWARRTRTHFVAVAVRDALVSGAERRIGPYDLARAFEASGRATALAAALQRSDPRVDGWLVGPWLGIGSDVAGVVSRAISRPVGESASAPGGAAGARFERRRDALFVGQGIGVHSVAAHAVRFGSVGASGATAATLVLENGGHLSAGAIVLAVGGVLAGGIELAHSGEANAWKLSLSAPVTFELDGEVFDNVSSLAGVSFQRLGFGALERIGVSIDSGARLAGELPLYGAGDVIAGRSRTVLSALASGLEAGGHAARASARAYGRVG